MTKQGLIPSLVLATILAGGAVVVWSLLSLWAVGIGAQVTGTAPAGEHLHFYADGTALLQEVNPHGPRRYRDLEGNPVAEPEVESITWWARLPARPAKDEARDVSWEQRLHALTDGQEPAGYWYFVADGRAYGSGYFVGYDSQSRTRIGFLGTAGFREGALPASEHFPCNGIASGPRASILGQGGRRPTDYPQEARGRAPRGCVSPWDAYVLGRRGEIYHVNLHDRTVHLARDEQELRSAMIGLGITDPIRGTPHHLLVRTDAAVLWCDEGGEELKRYCIPEVLRDRDFDFAETRTGEALMYERGPNDFLSTEHHCRIFWVRPDGRFSEADVTLRHPAERWMRHLSGVLVPAPVVLGGIVASERPGTLLEQGVATTYPEALSRALREFWPSLLIAQAIAVLFAGLCYRRQVRYGVGGTERVVWTLFVLFLGLPGWVAFRFGRTWPVLESCPACEHAVPQDRECCLRCEAEFPQPALKGTEVFA